MARTRRTARKSTRGWVPCHQLAPRDSHRKSKFLGMFGMPTLLWRVLSAMGYPEGREPRYYWSREQLGDRTLVGVKALIPTSGGDPTSGTWVYESRGSIPF